MNEFTDRVLSVQTYIQEHALDAALVAEPSNRRYLSGFRGSFGYVIITSEEQFFLTDFRYIEQACRQCPGYRITSARNEDDMIAFLHTHAIFRLALETDFVSVRLYQRLLDCGITHTEDIGQFIVDRRMIKELGELRAIKRACRITDLAFAALLPQLREGMTEVEVDVILQSNIRRFPEVERTADRFIVASGEHGSLPHGIAGKRRIRRGDFITMDFGCNCDGYWSDMTRTVCLGQASSLQREIYAVTLAAQNAAILNAAPGKTGRELDRIARDIITKAGYGTFFGHDLGHSFGLDIHESPRCAQNAAGDIVLRPGMIITIEPGIYLPEKMGVRIEDDILITEGGCLDLTGAEKKLREL